MTDQASDVGSASPLEVFSQATSIRAHTDETFDADLSAEWTIGGRPNGGYLLAILGRAATAVTGSGHVVTAGAQFLRAPAPGPVRLEAELLRRGRSISQVRVRMSQGDRPCVEALMTTGELDTSPAPRWDTGVPEDEPVPFDDCVRLAPITPQGVHVAVFEQVDVRLEKGSMGGITEGRPSGRGQLNGWLKLLGDEHFDPISLLYALDALPPPTFDTEFNAMVSTIELTAYVRAFPAPGPVRIVNRARLIDSQCVDETCDIWDVNGRLVAQATQLAKVPPS